MMTDELKAMTDIACTLDSITEKTVKKRILTWAWAKYIGEPEPSLSASEHSAGTAGSKKDKTKKITIKGISKKQTLSIVKDLNLTPSGKTSFSEFVESKAPKNLLHQVTIAVYYLCHELELDGVSVEHIYTCFKWIKWKLPSDFMNTIHQAGNKGWLDSKNRDNLTLTTMGENLIEHTIAK